MSCKIRASIFQVREEIELAVYVAFVEWKNLLDMTLLNRLIDIRPDMRVKIFIARRLIRQLDLPTHGAGGLERKCATRQPELIA